jgi:hypothetical protein
MATGRITPPPPKACHSRCESERVPTFLERRRGKTGYLYFSPIVISGWMSTPLLLGASTALGACAPYAMQACWVHRRQCALRRKIRDELLRAAGPLARSHTATCRARGPHHPAGHADGLGIALIGRGHTPRPMMLASDDCFRFPRSYPQRRQNRFDTVSAAARPRAFALFAS